PSLSPLFPYTTLFRSLHPVGPHGLEHVERCDRVLLQILARLLGPETHVGVRGEMTNKVGALQRLRQRGQVEQIRFDQPEPRILRSEEHTSELQSPDHL